ncbi:hypothetical protein BDW59DRAFT_157260 [Aspergillus cavernicola]|uniref:Carrier domain-containing protein n=1 Tax=Aspergillus cavernicola TaxID=176166 RepID=A0ABR4IXD5_9EURO
MEVGSVNPSYLVDASGTNDLCSSIIGLGNSKAAAAADTVTQSMWDRDARFGIYYYGLETHGEAKLVTYNDRVKALLAHVEADPSFLNEPEFEGSSFSKLPTEYMPSAADMDDEQIAITTIDSLMAIEINSATRRSLGIDVSLTEINRSQTVRGLAQLAVSHLKVKYQEGR